MEHVNGRINRNINILLSLVISCGQSRNRVDINPRIILMLTDKRNNLYNICLYLIIILYYYFTLHKHNTTTATLATHLSSEHTAAYLYVFAVASAGWQCDTAVSDRALEQHLDGCLLDAVLSVQHARSAIREVPLYCNRTTPTVSSLPHDTASTQPEECLFGCNCITYDRKSNNTRLT